MPECDYKTTRAKLNIIHRNYTEQMKPRSFNCTVGRSPEPLQFASENTQKCIGIEFGNAPSLRALANDPDNRVCMNCRDRKENTATENNWDTLSTQQRGLTLIEGWLPRIIHSDTSTYISVTSLSLLINGVLGLS